jgi:hypothetical protein
MDKLFALDGTYPALIRNLSVIERQRQAAINAAFPGDFGFSLALFRKAHNAVPYMPRGWKSHKEILQEIVYAMEDSYSQAFQKTGRTLYTNVVDVVKVTSEGAECGAVIEAILKEHLRDFQVAASIRMFLTYVRIFADSMCSADGDIQDNRLQQLETLLEKCYE